MELPSDGIKWTDHAPTTPVENMGIDHGGANILVAEQFWTVRIS